MRYRTRLLAFASILILLGATSAQAIGVVGIATGDAAEWGAEAGDLGVVWNVATRRDIDIRGIIGGQPFRMDPRAAAVATGGIDNGMLTYQMFGGDTSDIMRYDLVGERNVRLPGELNSKVWEHSPDSSGDWILFSRNNINYGRKREWQKVLLFNVTTREMRTLAKGSAKIWLEGMHVSGNLATWERCDGQGCRVFVYDIATREILEISDPQWFQYSPAVAPDGTVYYARSGTECGGDQIVRRAPDGSEVVIFQYPANRYALHLSVFVDDMQQHNLYMDWATCSNRAFRSDIYLLPAADTLPAIAAPASLQPVGAPGEPPRGISMVSRQGPVGGWKQAAASALHLNFGRVVVRT